MHMSATERYREEQFILQEELSKREVKEGDYVIYHDEIGTAHNALVTSGGYEYGSNKTTCWINVLYVSNDTSKKDSYGRQIERASSVSHVSQTTAWGRYWRWSEQKTNER